MRRLCQALDSDLRMDERGCTSATVIAVANRAGAALRCAAAAIGWWLGELPNGVWERYIYELLRRLRGAMALGASVMGVFSWAMWAWLGVFGQRPGASIA